MKDPKVVPKHSDIEKIKPLRISLVFAVIGCLWILLSDRVLALFVPDPAALTLLQTYKGWFFIFVTTAVLYTYLHREVARHESQDNDLDGIMHALEQERSRFEAIIAAMGEGISIQDIHFRVLYQNQVHRDLVGGDHVGELCYRAYRNRDEVCPECHLTQAYRDGKIHRSEQNRVTRKGLRHYEIVASPLLDASGNAVAGIEMVRDISDRRKLEELNRDILEAIDEAFIVIDREFRVISANRAYAEQVRMPSDDIIGKHCYEVSHKIPRPCYEAGEECTVKRTYETGLPHSAVHTHRDSAGNYVYVETKSFPMKDSTGAVVSVIETINNITGKRNLEEQLRQALKMEAVGTLTGGIAHDFNNILTAIIGYSSILKSQSRSGKASPEVIESLLAAANRASGLTKSLLTFSRKQTLEARPFDLNETVRNMEKLLTRVIGEDIELVTDLSGQELMVLGDTGQIEQVLMNLSANSRDAMTEGGTVTIATALKDLNGEGSRLLGLEAPGSYAVLQVGDTGAGMDEETRKKIFDPFFTTKEVGKGTGLGLSIVYGIVKQHRGNVVASSTPGKGSTFTMYLPLVPSRAGEQRAPAVIEPSRGTGTILLAEDSVEVRVLTRDILASAGYTIIESVDGDDAVRKFAANRDRVRLLVLDVIMPKKNGKQAYEEIRRMSPAVKALFISGYTADVLERKGIGSEHEQLLAKPFLPAELLRKVEKLMGRPSAS